jgi:N-methylhydantoinase B
MVIADPITLEVVRNALLMAVLEMKNIVVRSAYSTLWKEAGDLSCALLTRSGEVVAQGPGDIPVHLASMPLSLEGCLARIPAEELEPGDILLQNDPYQGNNHLPDLFMAAPVFAEDELIGFAAVRGHFVDVGGLGPGSYSALTRDIHAEGIRIPPVRLARRGRFSQEIVDIFLANVRVPEERMGDLRSQYAGCEAGRRSLERLAAKYGARRLGGLMSEILDYSEAMMRIQIGKIPDGVYEWTDYCDVQGDLIRIQVQVIIDGNRCIVDFTGSETEGPHGMNCPYPVTASATYYAVKCITEAADPNSGSYRPIEIIAPEGSVVNCRYPRSVILGNHETAARIVESIWGALSEAVPERVVAAGCGSSGVMVLAGRDSREPHASRDFVWLEVGAAGQGAALHKDGISGVRVNVGNTGNTPIEVIETSFPVTNLSYELVCDTGGAGRFRGACALRRSFEVHAEDAVITLSFEREFTAPYGLFGGGEGAPTHLTISRNGARETNLPSKTLPTEVSKGDVVSLQCAGGGGAGDPWERDPVFVSNDVRDGYVSVEAAHQLYGVVIVQAKDGFELDVKGTSRLRSVARRRTTKQGPS